jgi:hypothetical protein
MSEFMQEPSEAEIRSTGDPRNFIAHRMRLAASIDEFEARMDMLEFGFTIASGDGPHIGYADASQRASPGEVIPPGGTGQEP